MLYAKAQRSKQELVGLEMSVYIEGAGQGTEQAGNHYTLSFTCPIFGTGFPPKFYFLKNIILFHFIFGDSLHNLKFPNRGLHPGPLQWKRGILTAGLQGKFSNNYLATEKD